jgi:hypothetical protein
MTEMEKVDMAKQDDVVAEAPKPKTEQPTPGQGRLQRPDSPFRGIRNTLYYIRQILNIVFDLPTYLNERAAHQIVETGRGKISGYNDMIYFYRLIPSTVIMTGLSFVLTSETALLVMGLIWTLMLAFIVLQVAEDISGRMVGLVAGVIVAVAAIWTMLQVTDTLDVNSALWRVVETVKPTYARGPFTFFALIISFFVGGSIFKSRVHQVLNINGNRWTPSRFERGGTFDAVTHKLFVDTPDWAERVVGYRDLMLVSIASVSTGAELQDKADFTLRNVAAASTVFAAIECSAAAQESEQRHP